MFKKIYQYVSLSNDRETIQKIIDKAHGNIILDLEDTVENKQKAILTLRVLTDNPDINIHIRTHDKINLDYLENISLNIKEIFIPKVKNANEIQNLKKRYPKYKYIAMIEDKESLNKREELTACSDGIHFGYYDYCLSENLFPIEFKKEFFDIQSNLLSMCNKYNTKFISSPTKDTSILQYWLHTVTSFNVTILRYNQLKNLIPKYYYALDLIKKYESNEDVFFKDNEDFISPHEYKLAKRLIEEYHQK